MTLIKYSASNFKGDCMVDEDFATLLDQMNSIAKEFNLNIIITSSFRKDTNVAGAIVTPAKMSNHLIGHAIDCNLQDISLGTYFNSKAMADGKGKDFDFCQKIIAETKLRWGGAFNVPDSVHFDDGLNIHDPELWKEKYNEIHRA